MPFYRVLDLNKYQKNLCSEKIGNQKSVTHNIRVSQDRHAIPIAKTFHTTQTDISRHRKP